MYKINYWFAGFRGFLQGVKRGFYKEYSFEIQSGCFGEESEILAYKSYEIFEFHNWSRLFMVPGYVYDLFIMADQRCQLEENIYDVVAHCYDNDCSFEKIIENEEAAIFQIIGVLNSLAAAYYQDMLDIPPEHLHDAYFDIYSEIGRSCGTLLRRSFKYDSGGYTSKY